MLVDSETTSYHRCQSEIPGKSVPELVEQLRENHPELRSLFMPGYTGDLVALRGVVMQQASFLEEPFTKRSLLAKVYSVLHEQPGKQ
jgi:two-component system, cell cycle sensor histidine kinase and response regulator CckA